MRNEQAVTLIEQYGYLHGDHYSFNTREFLQWSAQSGEPVSSEEAELLLQPFCRAMGHGEEGILWRHYIR